MYYPLGITHSNKQMQLRLEQLPGPYVNYWLPICWFGFFFLTLVMCLFFASKKNRRFPACTLGWMLVFDWMYFLREIFRGSPFGVISEALLWSPTQDTCAALYLWSMWGDAASYIMGVFLCLFIYKIVVQKVNLKLDARFFWKFIATFFIYTTLYTLLIGVVASLDGYLSIRTGCGPINKGAPVLGIVQSFVIGIIQTVLLLLVLKYMIEVTASAPNVAHSSKKRFFILRFFLLVICETFPRIYYNAFYEYFTFDKTNNIIPNLQALYVIVSIFYLLAGVVVFTNTFVWTWFLRRFIVMKEIITVQITSQHSSLSHSSSFSTRTKTSPRGDGTRGDDCQDDPPITIVLENV